ncbi:SDR family NAD(P)-dependent oxidoreductase [Odoribacter lunatus]|uniref:SDR family NAD(P)-dependent oxidoreductase n=1 Tax=Odoribacter lunatus TaxID=2941335 RepID=UPI0020417BBB|nr:SDR family oxidoreductase [Odoribacter lunatus]
MIPLGLEGKTILVTGASSGIGAACALECSRSGANVVITGRNGERLQQTMDALDGNRNKQVLCDLTLEDELNLLIDQLPKLDGIVLCAGINQTLPLAFLSRKKVDKIFNTNFFSQVELLRLLIKNKLLNEGASIVAMSSIGGTASFTLGAAAYGASKAALLSWMKSAARELAPKVRVNCIAPGQVNTPMNVSSNITEEQYQAYQDSIPMKRFGEPEEIAYLAVFLLSDAAKWIAGSVMTIDGGTTL